MTGDYWQERDGSVMADSGSSNRWQERDDCTMTVSDSSNRAAIAAQLPADPRLLLSDEDRAQLDADLQELARQRRKAEAEAAHIPLAGRKPTDQKGTE